VDTPDRRGSSLARTIRLGVVVLVSLFAAGILVRSAAAPAGSVPGAAYPSYVDWAGHLACNPESVSVQGDYAYVGMTRELAVLDVSDPAYPVRVGYALLPGGASDVQVAGDFAYAAIGTRYALAAATSGVTIHDTCQPSSSRDRQTMPAL
jgi:hypothetical protein